MVILKKTTINSENRNNKCLKVLCKAELHLNKILDHPEEFGCLQIFQKLFNSKINLLSASWQDLRKFKKSNPFTAVSITFVDGIDDDKDQLEIKHLFLQF